MKIRGKNEIKKRLFQSLFRSIFRREKKCFVYKKCFSVKNINTKEGFMLAQCTTICPLKIYPEPRLILCRDLSLNDRVSAIASKNMNISNFCQSSAQPSCEYADFSVAQFIRFLKHIKLKGLLSKI